MFDTATVLELGARGRDFTLASRTCIRGKRGAIWNEWTLRCDDGRPRFLSESGDAFTLYEEGSLVPELASLIVGQPLETGYFVVARGEAERLAHWGSAEGAPKTYAYVDLARADGSVATLDFGGVPRLFVGRRVTLDELALPHLPRRGFVPTPNVSRPREVQPWLDVGAIGELEGTSFVVVGMLSRQSDSETWDEYLLHHPAAGLRWLVLARGHWSLARSVPVTHPGHGAGSEARVIWATGELPWEVAIGDRSFIEETADLAIEWTADEIAWSRATPITTDAIAKAFGKRALPKPQ